MDKYIICLGKKSEYSNMQRINLTPAQQTGHNCKITAVACVDAYYGNRFNYQPFLLHKNNYVSSLPGISIRQIAKKFGSQQGELLEINQVQKILNYIGYEVEEVNFKENLELFRNEIRLNVSLNTPLMVFFAANRDDGLPIIHSEISGSNEHAAIITGYNPEKDEIELVHWGRRHVTKLSLLFGSANSLLEQRNNEFYKSIKKSNQVKKYDLAEESELKDPSIKVSIQPEKKSGFCAKLIKIKPPILKDLMERRQRIVLENASVAINYSIKRIVKRLRGARKTLAIQEGEKYKNFMRDACENFIQNGNELELKKSLETAEKEYCDKILAQDCSQGGKVNRYIMMILANLGLHIFGLMTLGLGLYFNKKNKEKTGNWLFFSDTRSAQSLKITGREIRKLYKL